MPDFIDLLSNMMHRKIAKPYDRGRARAVRFARYPAAYILGTRCGGVSISGDRHNFATAARRVVTALEFRCIAARELWKVALPKT
jgi:hypothetical protein